MSIEYTDYGDTPFLTIVTRHHMIPERLDMMMANRKSVSSQVCQDYEVVTILDRVGRGRRWAASSLVPHSNRIRGEYVMCLDDDDQFTVDDFVSSLQLEVRESDEPDVIVWRMADPRGPRWTSPLPDAWKSRPKAGRIGQSFAVRRELFVEYAYKQAEPDKRIGDCVFLQALWDSGVRFHWWDRIVTRRNAIGALNE